MDVFRHLRNILCGRFSKKLQANELLDEEKKLIHATQNQQARSEGLGVQIDLLVDQINRRTSDDRSPRNEAN